MLKKFLPLAVVGLLAGCNGGSDETAAESDYPAEFALPAVNENLDQTSPEGVWMITALADGSEVDARRNEKSKTSLIGIISITSGVDAYDVEWCQTPDSSAYGRSFVYDETQGTYVSDATYKYAEEGETNVISLKFSENFLQLTGSVVEVRNGNMVYDENSEDSIPYVDSYNAKLKAVKISDAATISDEVAGLNLVRANIKQGEGSSFIDTDNGAVHCFSYIKTNNKSVFDGKSYSYSDMSMQLVASRFGNEFTVYYEAGDGYKSVQVEVPGAEFVFDANRDEDFLGEYSADLAVNIGTISSNVIAVSVKGSNTDEYSIDMSMNLTPLAVPENF